MSKLLLFVLVLVAVYLVRRAMSQSSTRAQGQHPPAGPQVERMVECVQCGVHIPEGEALQDGGLTYCCEAHRQLHQGRG